METAKAQLWLAIREYVEECGGTTYPVSHMPSIRAIMRINDSINALVEASKADANDLYQGTYRP